MTCQRSLCYNVSIGLFHPSGETFLSPQCGEIFLIWASTWNGEHWTTQPEYIYEQTSVWQARI